MIYAKVLGAFLFGLFLGCISMAAGYDRPVLALRDLKADAINRGLAQYNSTTGIWEWKP